MGRKKTVNTFKATNESILTRENFDIAKKKKP